MDSSTKPQVKNLEKYRKDLDALVNLGVNLYYSMVVKWYSEQEIAKILPLTELENELEGFIKTLPDFYSEYQGWYSESLSIIKFLLPNRINDFVSYYETPSNRAKIDFATYVVKDYLHSIYTYRNNKLSITPKAAITRFQQQLAILKACQKRFESSLFDVKSLLQGDLFDSELEAAKDLNSKGLYRAAGAIVGVVLETHFAQVCENHNLKLPKKDPTINDYNDFLKKEEIITLNTYKHISLLGDIRNLCTHKKSEEPTKDDVDRLISGAQVIMKTIF